MQTQIRNQTIVTARPESAPAPVNHSPIILHLDRSGFPRGLCLTRGDRQVDVGEALNEGFVVSANDSPAILTLASRFIESREQNAR